MPFKTNYKIYVVTGEVSGENIIYQILKELSKKNVINLYGIGGMQLKSLGLKPLFSYTELSIMGLLEVLPKIPKILFLLNKVVNDILKVEPDLIITVDAPDFSFRVLKRVKKRNSLLKNLHIVAPTVWAWKSGRAKKISFFIDNLFVLFPFESKYFTKYKINTKFIGHPILDLIDNRKKTRNKFTRVISLFPGSRKKEIKLHLKIILDFLIVYKDIHNYQVVIVGVDKYLYLISKIYDPYKSKLNIKIVSASQEKQNIFNKTYLAIAVSGTITLELALNLIPTIVVYKLNTVSFSILKKLVKTKYISLINILLNKKVLPELVQKDLNERNLRVELDKLLNNRKEYQKQLQGFKKARELLSDKKKHIAFNAAKEIKRILETKP